MSYLDTPGISFAGRFQADVPTGNNEPGNYDPTAPPDLMWNRLGSGAFQFVDCAVREVRSDAPANDDPVRTARVTDADDRVAAKIVDLDPQYQVASQLYGLRVRFVAGDGSVLLAGEFAPSAFRDIWFRGPNARFQSVLTDLTWAPDGTSDALDRLRAESAAGRVAIRLVTYGFGSGVGLTGVLLGAVGPYRHAEPRQFVGRALSAAVPVFRADSGPAAPAPVALTEGNDRLTVDLANALPRAGTALTSIGSLRLGVLTDPATAQGAPVTDGQDVVTLGGEIPYGDPDWLPSTNGLVSVAVPEAARALVADHPLALISADPAPRVLIREATDGWLVGADVATWRIEAGADAYTAVHVTRYGRPHAGVRLDARLAPLFPPSVGPPTGVPESAITIHPLEPTDDAGRTTLRVTTADPKEPGEPRPRPDLEGQLYRVVVGGGGTTGSAAVVALVFEAYAIPQQPTWAHVRKILEPYSRLYPVMTERLMDLSSYPDVARYREAIRLALGLDIGDPNAMPVTRDLSGPKRDTVLAWLALPELPGGDDTADVAITEALAPARVRHSRLPTVAPQDPVSTKGGKDGRR